MKMIDKIKNRIKNRIPSKLWYKYFFKKTKETKFDSVELPKVNRKII